MADFDPTFAPKGLVAVRVDTPTCMGCHFLGKGTCPGSLPDEKFICIAENRPDQKSAVFIKPPAMPPAMPSPKKPATITRITAMTVCPDGDPLTGEMSTAIAIINEGNGELVELRQVSVGVVQITKAEWPVLREAIDNMVSECRA